jgi:hypothetical protein
LKFCENFEILYEILVFFVNFIKILDLFVNFVKFRIFENFYIFWQFDWPTGNEILSLVGQR